MIAQLAEAHLARALLDEDVRKGHQFGRFTSEGYDQLAARIIASMREAGFRIVHPEAMFEDCMDWWNCCIHTPPDDELP